MREALRMINFKGLGNIRMRMETCMKDIERRDKNMDMELRIW